MAEVPRSVADSGDEAVEESLRDILYSAYVSAFKGDKSTVARPLTKGQEVAYERFVMPFLDGLPKNAMILDLGCGDGSLLSYLTEQGYENCHGVDCSREQVAIAVARGVSAEAGNLFDELVRWDSACELILAIDVIEHMTKPELAKLGRLVARALKPGGRFAVQTPNGEGLSHGNIVYGDLTHETIFNESSITQFFRAFGFEHITVREAGPIPHSLFGMVRYVGWRVLRVAAQAASLIQTGRSPRVLTAVLLASGRRPGRT